MQETQETWFDTWVRKITWREKWQPIPKSLPGKSHGQRSLAGCSPWGHKGPDMTKHTHTHTHTHTHLLWLKRDKEVSFQNYKRIRYHWQIIDSFFHNRADGFHPFKKIHRSNKCLLWKNVNTLKYYTNITNPLSQAQTAHPGYVFFCIPPDLSVKPHSK